LVEQFIFADSTAFLAMRKVVLSPTYSNFERPLKSCDISLVSEVLMIFGYSQCIVTGWEFNIPE
jgi:hypothetical protein